MLRKLLLVIFILGLLGISYGEEPVKEKDGCGAEIKKLCGDIEKGGGRVHDCLTKKMSSLSPKCQERAKMRQERFEKMKACRDEMKKLCGDVERGEGRKKKCMEENKSKLSPECQAMGEQIKKRLEQRQSKKGEKMEKKTPPTP